jgi:hypothetical protein
MVEIWEKVLRFLVSTNTSRPGHGRRGVRPHLAAVALLLQPRLQQWMLRPLLNGLSLPRRCLGSQVYGRC